MAGERLALLDLGGGRNARVVACGRCCCGFNGTKLDFRVALATVLGDIGAFGLGGDDAPFTDGAMVGGVSANGAGAGRCGFNVEDGAAAERDGFG